MPSSHPHAPAASPRGRRLAAGLGLAIIIGMLPWATATAASPVEPSELRPTIHYDEAVAHAADAITFSPGGRVTVPFRPRSTDRWLVGGRAPRVLPAGRLSGRELRSASGADADAPARPTPDAAPSPTDAPPTDAPTTSPGPSASDAPTSPPAPPALDQPIVDPAAQIPATLAAVVDPGGLKREVFGFLPYWELSDSSTRLDWEKISTVAYFGVGTDSKGNLLKKDADGTSSVGWSGWTSSKLTSVINAAHMSGARVVLTVQSFAWSSTGLSRQKKLLGSATARANLARQIATAIRDRGADGVNLDFEPLASGYADEFTALVRKIRTQLDATAPGYQLTFDTTGWIGNYPVEDATAPGGADAIMVMAYDYRSSGASVAGSVAPLRASIYDITDTLDAYLARVPASKLILGVPYYGRAWSTKSDALHSANISGAKYGASTTAVYTTARELVLEHGRRYDATEGVAWTAYRRKTCTSTYGCVTAWRQLYYDDSRALKAKYDLVNRHDLRGVGLWALGYDGTRPELYQALEDKFITDSVPPAISGGSITLARISPNGDGRAETTTASLSASAFIRWGYRVARLDDGVPGPTLRSGTVEGKDSRWNWNGKDADGAVVRDGTYRVTLWVADASDNRSSRSFDVTVDTRPPTITSSATYAHLSPDGDGHTDTTRLTWTSSQAVTGTVRLVGPSGASVRSWPVAAKTSWATTWDGRGTDGTIVPDGRYTYRVDGRDSVGNRTVQDRPVLVDRTLRTHQWSDASFDPRDGERTRMTVGLRRSATVRATIYLGTSVVRRIWADRSLAAGSYGWTWNGRTGSGAVAKAGRYKVVVSATSRFGTTRWTRYVTVEAH